MIRDATPLDAGKIGAILSEFTAKTDWMPLLHSKAEDIHFCDQMISKNWVRVYADPNVRGFIAKNGSEILSLYVDFAHHRRGIARALITDARSKSDDLNLWTFQKNEGARQFYLEMGFEEITRTEGTHNDEGLPDIHFQWKRHK